jgi:hypothetical protein
MKTINQVVGKVGVSVLVVAFIAVLGSEVALAHEGACAGGQIAGSQGGSGFFRNFLQQHPNLKERLKAKADQNGDGVIDEVERGQAREILQDRWDEWSEERPGLSERLDRNNDGNIGLRESQYGRRLRNGNEFFDNHPGLENRVDRNDDGNVGPREFKNAQNMRRVNEYADNHPRHENRVDRNDDGRVNRVETRRARQIRNNR